MDVEKRQVMTGSGLVGSQPLQNVGKPEQLPSSARQCGWNSRHSSAATEGLRPSCCGKAKALLRKPREMEATWIRWWWQVKKEVEEQLGDDWNRQNRTEGLDAEKRCCRDGLGFWRNQVGGAPWPHPREHWGKARVCLGPTLDHIA